MEITPIPIYISALFILLTLFLAIMFLVGLRYALVKDGKNPNRPLLFTAIGLIAWFIYAGALSLSGILYQFDKLPPRLFLVFIPTFIAIGIIAKNSRTRELIQLLPPAWVHGLQGFRIFMEIILWLLFVEAVIPVQMTFEGWNFDVLSGIFGPVIAWFCFVKKSWSLNVAKIYNYAGILLLFIIVIIALVSTPSPMRLFMNDPVNTMPAVFPMVYLPSFVVPMALLLHVIALVQLNGTKRA